MRIFLDENFIAHPEPIPLLGVDGETNARKITFHGLYVENATEYDFEALLHSGKYSGVIVNGVYTVENEIVGNYGKIKCQIVAKNGTSLVKKSNIFELDVLPSLDSAEALSMGSLTAKALTKENYESMVSHDPKALYIVTNNNVFELFFGDLPLKSGGGVTAGAAALSAAGAVGFAGIAERVDE